MSARISEDLALAVRPLEAWEKPVVWSLDSACTIHLTPHKHVFNTNKAIQKGQKRIPAEAGVF